MILKVDWGSIQETTGSEVLVIEGKGVFKSLDLLKYWMNYRGLKIIVLVLSRLLITRKNTGITQTKSEVKKNRHSRNEANGYDPGQLLFKVCKQEE